jgi:hypothetical protein
LLELVFLLGTQKGMPAAIMKPHQAIDAVTLKRQAPLPDPLVIQKQNFRHLPVTHPLVQQNQRIRTPGKPVFR